MRLDVIGYHLDIRQTEKHNEQATQLSHKLNEVNDEKNARDFDQEDFKAVKLWISKQLRQLGGVISTNMFCSLLFSPIDLSAGKSIA